jgi:hypothetical protein
MKNIILLKNNLVEIPKGSIKSKNKVEKQLLGTILSNLAYYGFAPSQEAFDKLILLNETEIKTWWTLLEPSLKEVTGDSKNLDKYVVYKNFPHEVLEMSEAEYWIKQICMYIGFPNDLFTESEIVRDKMMEKLSLKVLQPATNQSLVQIANKLLQLPVRWTKEQINYIQFIIPYEFIVPDLTKIPFKENMVQIAKFLIDEDVELLLKSATDILRLAVAVSDGDVTLRTNTKFINFTRKYRKTFLRLLDNSSNLEDDVTRDPERWKKFLHHLHPGDYNFDRVIKMHDKLYKDQARSFNSKIETLIKNKDKTVFKLLQNRSGDFMRRYVHLNNVFGSQITTKNFKKVLPKLSTAQLLKFNRYINTINNRSTRTFPPKGNWGKLQIVENTVKLSSTTIKNLSESISDLLKTKLKISGIKSVNLDPRTEFVKLQSNDADLTSYGRGTIFTIPENVKFIRTASYWEHKSYGNNWFDNGWNFFDENWMSVGTCCWNLPYFPTNRSFWNRTPEKSSAAIYAGDPTNSKEMNGKAAEIIDLYFDKLQKEGVRYAVWNILCYSRVKFKDAKDVFAALQWGEELQKGKLFEPSRCQLAFQLTGDYYTKYVAYIDFKERKLVYMDANFKANVSSAGANSTILEKVMPAYVEYLNTLPSIHDLFNNVRKTKTGLPVLYSDNNTKINKNQAFVFNPENPDNKYEQVNVAEILNS